MLFRSLEKEMATHSSILAWEISQTEEPGGLQSMGLKRVGHDRVTEHTHVFIAVRGLSLVASSRATVHYGARASPCFRPLALGARAQLLCGMWDLPRPGIESMPPTLPGGFLTTVPLGKFMFSLF